MPDASLIAAGRVRPVVDGGWLEDALKRINSELGSIAGNLETVHQASERRETDTVREAGRKYLDQVDTLIK